MADTHCSKPAIDRTLALLEGDAVLPLEWRADLDNAADFARGAKSAATQRAYRSDFAIFSAWCTKRGCASLPADPASVAAFLAHEAKRGVKVSTISRRVAAIRYANALANHPTPTDHSAVKATLQGIRRTLGTAPDKKAPVLAEMAIAMTGTHDGSLRALRDRAMLLLGFAGGFRRSELVALDVADLTETPEGLRVLLRRSKTDQEGAGFTKAIVRGQVACPVAGVRAWLDAAGITDGPIFRRIRGRRAVTTARLKDAAVAEIVKAGVARLGLDVGKYSGHSLRAGLCTSAAKRGADLFKLMDITGHKSLDTLRGYVRDAELFRDHAAAGLL